MPPWGGEVGAGLGRKFRAPGKKIMGVKRGLSGNKEVGSHKTLKRIF